MTCKAVQALCGAFLDGELSGAESMAIRRHLADCRECSKTVDQERALKLALANLRVVGPSADFENRLMKHVFNAPREPSRVRVVGAYAVVAMATTLAAFTVYGKMQRSQIEARNQALAEREQRMFEIQRHQTDISRSDPMSPGSGIILVNNASQP